jgi:putative spermidine/putrescine transport system permease protein
MRAGGDYRPRISFGRVSLWVLVGFIIVFLVLPTLIVIPLSFSSASYFEFPPQALSLRWYQDFFLTDVTWLSATSMSFRAGALTALLATTLGTAAALGLTRGRFPGKQLLNTFIAMPLVIPTIVVAIAVYGLFSRLQLTGSLIGLVIGHTILGIPYVVILVSATLRGFDESLEMAAMSLGADRLRTFWHVTLPLIQPGVLSGALFAFLISFDELLVAMFLTRSNITLPIRMWEGLRTELTPTIAAASTMLMTGYVLVMLGAELARRRIERMRGGSAGGEEVLES